MYKFSYVTLTTRICIFVSHLKKKHKTRQQEKESLKNIVLTSSRFWQMKGENGFLTFLVAIATIKYTLAQKIRPYPEGTMGYGRILGVHTNLTIGYICGNTKMRIRNA